MVRWTTHYTDGLPILCINRWNDFLGGGFSVWRCISSFDTTVCVATRARTFDLFEIQALLLR